MGGDPWWWWRARLERCSPRPATAAPPEGRLAQAGRRLTAPDGRLVVLHGINMVYKSARYVPADTVFGDDDARFLAEHGFNTVRLV